MSIMNCPRCNCNIDTDENVDHDADCLGAEPEDETAEDLETTV